MKKRKHAVLIGGGTGTKADAQGLTPRGFYCTAITTTGDNGGSSEPIVEGLKIGPPGDIRQFLSGLTDAEVADDLEWRFPGPPFYGHPLGNIILAALIKKHGQMAGIERYRRMIGVEDTGNVIPMTPGPLTLRLTKADGSVVEGENQLGEECSGKDYFPAGHTPNLTLIPDADAFLRDEAYDLIANEADVIVIGPGKWFTSVTPTMLVKRMLEALQAAKARGVAIICIVPIMTHSGQTVGLCAAQHIAVLEALLGAPIFTHAIVNTKRPSQENLARYAKEDEAPVEVDPSKFAGMHYQVYAEPVLSEEVREQNPHDLLVRTVIRHDPDALGDLITEITLRHRREGKSS